MRNLKKILALVLSLMMVLSVMVTASAADFSDADEIQYTEAVDVMSALGILAGVDGKFVPQGTLTRAQAAKIITFIALGANTDALVKGTGSDQFSDVTGGWAYDYISYCANEGIINGDEGKFFPDANVTGYQFGKMVLLVAGVEGTYTGSGWEVNVAKDLKNNKLTSGLAKSFTLGRAITREEAAQMAWNAMNLGPVEVVTKYKVMGISNAFITAADTVDGKTYGTKATAIAAAASIDVASGTKAKLNEDYVIEEVATKVKDTSKSLGAVNYSLDVQGTTDNYGREGYFYFTNPYGLAAYNKDYCTKLGTYYYAPDVTYTVTNSKVTSVKAILKELGLTDYATASLLGDSHTLGLGNTVEIYSDGNGELATALVFDTNLAQVVKVVAADAKADYDYVVTLKGNGSTRSYTSDKLEGFDAATMVKDTYVTVYSDNATAGVIAVATPAVTGNRTAYGTGYVKFNGVQYSLKNNVWAVNALDNVSEFDVYTDANGYVIGYAAVKAAATEINIFYVKDANFNPGSAFSGTYAQLEVVHLDGITEVVDMAVKTGKKVNLGETDAAGKTILSDLTAANGNSLKNKFYAYTLNADGEVDSLTKIEKLAARGYNVVESGKTITVEQNKAKVTGTATTGLFATASTILRNINDTTGATSTVTGYKNVNSSVTFTAASNKPVLYVTKGTTLLAVYAIDSTTIAADSTYGYFVKTGDTYYSAALKRYVTDVVYNVNGTDVTYTVADDATVIKGLADITVTDGLATLASHSAQTDKYLTAVNDDYAIIGGDAVNFATGVKLYDATKPGAVTALDELTAGTVVTYVTDASGKISVVYVTYAAPAEDAFFGPAVAPGSSNSAYKAYLMGLGYGDTDAESHAALGTDGLLLKWTYAAAANYDVTVTIKDKDGNSAASYSFTGISKDKNDHSVMVDMLHDLGTNHSGNAFAEGTYTYEIKTTGTTGEIVIAVGSFTYEK